MMKVLIVTSCTGEKRRLELGNADAKSFGYGLVGLKGFLFKKLAECFVRDPQLLKDAFKSPNDLCMALDDFRKTILDEPVQ